MSTPIHDEQRADFFSAKLAGKYEKAREILRSMKENNEDFVNEQFEELDNLMKV